MAAERYVKTPKGLEEITRRSHGLAQRWRRLLIMIDGKRDADILAGLMPGEDAARALRQLLDDGYIMPLAPEPPPNEQPIAAVKRVPIPGNDAERLDMARNFMLNTLNAFVGMAASSLINRVEASISIEMLQDKYAEWREAITLSSDGRKRLPELEGRLAPLLS